MFANIQAAVVVYLYVANESTKGSIIQAETFERPGGLHSGSLSNHLHPAYRWRRRSYATDLGRLRNSHHSIRSLARGERGLLPQSSICSSHSFFKHPTD